MLIYVEIFDLKITLVQYELMHNFGGQRVNKNCTLDWFNLSKASYRPQIPPTDSYLGQV